jgi:hypothetical protein
LVAVIFVKVKLLMDEKEEISNWMVDGWLAFIPVGAPDQI